MTRLSASGVYPCSRRMPGLPSQVRLANSCSVCVSTHPLPIADASCARSGAAAPCMASLSSLCCRTVTEPERAGILLYHLCSHRVAVPIQLRGAFREDAMKEGIGPDLTTICVPLPPGTCRGAGEGVERRDHPQPEHSLRSGREGKAIDALLLLHISVFVTVRIHSPVISCKPPHTPMHSQYRDHTNVYTCTDIRTHAHTHVHKY